MHWFVFLSLEFPWVRPIFSACPPSVAAFSFGFFPPPPHHIPSAYSHVGTYISVWVCRMSQKGTGLSFPPAGFYSEYVLPFREEQWIFFGVGRSGWLRVIFSCYVPRVQERIPIFPSALVGPTIDHLICILFLSRRLSVSRSMFWSRILVWSCAIIFHSACVIASQRESGLVFTLDQGRVWMGLVPPLLWYQWYQDGFLLWLVSPRGYLFHLLFLLWHGNPCSSERAFGNPFSGRIGVRIPASRRSSSPLLHCLPIGIQISTWWNERIGWVGHLISLCCPSQQYALHHYPVPFFAVCRHPLLFHVNTGSHVRPNPGHIYHHRTLPATSVMGESAYFFLIFFFRVLLQIRVFFLLIVNIIRLIHSVLMGIYPLKFHPFREKVDLVSDFLNERIFRT